MDALTIYQVGDVVIPRNTTDYHGYSVTTEATPANYLLSENVTKPTPRAKGLRNISVSFKLINNESRSQDQFFNRLARFTRRRTDIFAFVHHSDPDVVTGAFAPEHRHMLWFHCTGYVTSISSSESDGILEATVELLVDNLWESVNRMEWRYGVSGPGITNLVDVLDVVQDVDSYVYPYPDMTTVVYDYKHGAYWHKMNIWSVDAINWMLWAETWAGFTDYFPPGSPAIGLTGSLGRSDTASVYPDITMFNAPPKSLYRIKLYDVDNTEHVYNYGTATLKVVNQGSIWNSKISNVVIDLAQLDTDLDDAGFNGILSGDILYFGDWPKRPGFIVRWPTMLAFYPRLTYTTEFPGQLEASDNTLTLTTSVSVEGFHSNMNLEYLHIYRRF